MLLPIIVRFYVFVLNVCPGPYFRRKQFERRGGLPGVCVAAVSEPGAHRIKRQLFGLVRIESHRAAVFVEPCLAVVDMVRKMITRSGNS